MPHRASSTANSIDNRLASQPTTARRGMPRADGAASAWISTSNGRVPSMPANTADPRAAQGRIASVEPLGRETLYEVTTPLGGLRVLEAGSDRRFHEADPVTVAVPDEALLVFDKASERRLEQARPILSEAA